MKQKFMYGDLIRIIRKLPPHMSHFTTNKRAIVLHSYYDEECGILMEETGMDSYTIYIEGEGECAWYEENHLILLERKCFDLLGKWKLQEHSRIHSEEYKKKRWGKK